MDKVWWNHITKAHKFFEDIVETAVKGSSMLLSLPASVPWKETLIEMIGERLQLENPKNAFHVQRKNRENIFLRTIVKKKFD